MTLINVRERLESPLHIDKHGYSECRHTSLDIGVLQNQNSTNHHPEKYNCNCTQKQQDMQSSIFGKKKKKGKERKNK